MPGPAGDKLRDGFACLITFSLAPTLELFEVETKPAGWDAGGGIDNTTMRNVRVRTMSGKALISTTPITGRAGFAPSLFQNAVNIMGKNGQITCTWPNGATQKVWGILDKLEPDGLSEGKFPTASYTVIPTNHDNTGAEALPEYTAASTTTSTTTTTVI